LTKSLIFDQISDFWQKVQFFRPKIRFLTNSSEQLILEQATQHLVRKVALPKYQIKKSNGEIKN